MVHAVGPLLNVAIGENEFASGKQLVELAKEQRYGKVGVGFVEIKIRRRLENVFALAVDA